MLTNPEEENFLEAELKGTLDDMQLSVPKALTYMRIDNF